MVNALPMQIKTDSVESRTQNKTKTVEDIFSFTNRFPENAVIRDVIVIGNKIKGVPLPSSFLIIYVPQ